MITDLNPNVQIIYFMVNGLRKGCRYSKKGIMFGVRFYLTFSLNT
jgi:hypothetical protein